MQHQPVGGTPLNVEPADVEPSNVGPGNIEPQWSAATARVQQHQRFVVVGHITPDADDIGSVCAVVAGLRQLGKEAVGAIGQTLMMDDALLTIPGADEVQLTEQLPPCDTIIVVDCGSPSRMGVLEQAVMQRETDVILIDHHASNTGYRGINLIDYTAESTTTIIRQWFHYLGVELTKDIAHGLYTGLLTDTGGFRWGRPAMHALAQELVNTGLDIRTIGNQMFDGLSISDLTMIGKVLSSLEVRQSDCHQIVFACATYDVIHGHSIHAVESIADYVRGMRDIDISVIIKEYEPGFAGVSLRSDFVDVSELARYLGGGGHLRSAGFTCMGSIEEITNSIISAANQSCPVLRKNQETPIWQQNNGNA